NVRSNPLARSPGDDSIEIPRESLGLRQSLTSALRKAHEVGLVRRPIVVMANQRLSNHGTDVGGSQSIVDFRLEIVVRPHEVSTLLEASAPMAAVGNDAGIASPQRIITSNDEGEGSARTTATPLHELSIPLGRQPHFKADTRPNVAGYLAVGREI